MNSVQVVNREIERERVVRVVATRDDQNQRLDTSHVPNVLV